jgi:hypothetical protein
LVALDEKFNMSLWPAPENFRIDVELPLTSCAV